MSSPRGKAIIFSAPSGAGKTTIARAVMKKFPQLAFSVSATTREKRKNEVNGQDYFFVTEKEFKDKIYRGEFLEWEEVYDGIFYGSLKKEVERMMKAEKFVVFDVDVKGGLNVKNHFGKRAIAFFIMPPSLNELEIRLRKRKTESDTDIRKRITKAKEEMEYSYQFDAVVLNRDLKKAVEMTCLLIKYYLDK